MFVLFELFDQVLIILLLLLDSGEFIGGEFCLGVGVQDVELGAEFEDVELESLDLLEDVLVDLEEGEFVSGVDEEEAEDVLVVVGVLCFFQQDEDVLLDL